MLFHFSLSLSLSLSREVGAALGQGLAELQIHILFINPTCVPLLANRLTAPDVEPTSGREETEIKCVCVCVPYSATPLSPHLDNGPGITDRKARVRIMI